jgi:FkbM family methyltransferase
MRPKINVGESAWANHFPITHHKNLVKWAGQSRAQIGQDLFVLTELDFKCSGYFVEFGATDGVALSNTWLLEKMFAWNGILAEPARCWLHQLKLNRQAAIDEHCIWMNSGLSLRFNETPYAELSTIDSYSNNDYHSASRATGHHYDVKTLSLNDLLAKHNAPRQIDYLSIDTEGSEFDILSNFDFENYDIKVITCEHNFTPNRNKIFELLTAHGYVRKYVGLSSFDDWYVRERVI